MLNTNGFSLFPGPCINAHNQFIRFRHNIIWCPQRDSTARHRFTLFLSFDSNIFFPAINSNLSQVCDIVIKLWHQKQSSGRKQKHEWILIFCLPSMTLRWVKVFSCDVMSRCQYEEKLKKLRKNFHKFQKENAKKVEKFFSLTKYWDESKTLYMQHDNNKISKPYVDKRKKTNKGNFLINDVFDYSGWRLAVVPP